MKGEGSYPGFAGTSDNGLRRRVFAWCAASMTCMAAHAAQVVIHVSGVASASITAETRGASPIAGKIEDDRVIFSELKHDVLYTVQLTHADGSVDQGFDAGWYDKEPARDEAGELTDDDRQQIAAVTQVLSFYNRCEVLQLIGNHDRATALVQLVRDRSFHSDSGNEVIWHVELWYLKNRHGGWENTQQVNKVLRRERFATEAAYHAAVDKLRWRAELGGLGVPAGQDVADVTAPK